MIRIRMMPIRMMPIRMIQNRDSTYKNLVSKSVHLQKTVGVLTCNRLTRYYEKKVFKTPIAQWSDLQHTIFQEVSRNVRR